MSHPYGAHDYTIHITNANHTHEFILSFVHFCYLDSKSLFCNLEFRLLCVCISFFLTIWSFHVPRQKCDLNFTKPTTYDLDFHQRRYGSRGKSFYFNSSLLFDSCVSRRRRICFFTSEPVLSDPLCLPSNELLSYFITNRKSQNDCTVLFRSFVMFANCWISFAVFIDRSFLVSTISPDYSHWFCLSQPHPDNPMRKNFCILTIRS